MRLLPGWTPGLFQQRHVEQGGGKGSGGETEAGRGPALVSPSQVGQNPDIPVPCWGGYRVSGKELSKGSMGREFSQLPHHMPALGSESLVCAQSGQSLSRPHGL